MKNKFTIIVNYIFCFLIFVIKQRTQMKIEFNEEYLKELFETSKTTNKKYRFQPQIVKQYIKVVKMLEICDDIESLYQFKSLHYEKKIGNLDGIEAVYVNMQYRLEFISRQEGKEPDTITICKLINLSNHYD